MSKLETHAKILNDVISKLDRLRDDSADLSASSNPHLNEFYSRLHDVLDDVINSLDLQRTAILQLLEVKNS